jgi:hypothetical protein
MGNSGRVHKLYLHVLTDWLGNIMSNKSQLFIFLKLPPAARRGSEISYFFSVNNVTNCWMIKLKTQKSTLKTEYSETLT